jgi:hypothetical protein
MYFTLLKYQRLLEAIGKSEDVGKSCRGRNQYSAVTERKKTRKFISLCNTFTLCSEVTYIFGVTVWISYSEISGLFPRHSPMVAYE